MPVLSDSILRARLPSGNDAVYSLSPQHANDRPGTTLNDRCLAFGRMLAHEHSGRWYEVGGWREITDLRTLTLLERASSAF